tara:strand:- start:448 stop:759 length:312 start_codon:yes stop_codon:yes gene_type:complete
MSFDDVMNARLVRAFKRLGVAAIFTPAGGDSKQVQAVIDTPDNDAALFDHGARLSRYTADLLRSDVGHVQEGDGLSVDGEAFRVGKIEEIDAGLVWRCGLVPA